MQSLCSVRARAALLLAAAGVCVLSASSCSKSSDPSILGTFRMGEKIQMGGISYTILETQWKPALTDSGAGRPPKDRYLFVRISATNGGGAVANIPAFTIVGPNDRTYN